MAAPMKVEVVSPTGVIWEGEAISVIANTVLGPIGILHNHEPLLAVLAPGVAEVVTVDGRRDVIAVEGGVLSVYENRISILSDSAILASEISLDDARLEYAELKGRWEAGELTEKEERRFDQLTAQVKAGQKYLDLRA